jgi:spermidine/putrescine transport system substrate-binding protein
MNDATNIPTGSNAQAPVVHGLTQRRLSRRELLRYAGAGVGAVGLAAFLEACGIQSQKSKSAASPGFDWQKWWNQQKQTGTLDFGNWPLYIDAVQKGGKTIHPSINLFTKETGIKVNYSEPIQDDPSFFGKIQPQLAAGQSIGYDIIVITNGIYLTKLIELNYLTPLDQTRLKNFRANAAPKYQNPSYDPGNKHSMAWQSGFTGIGYNPKLTDKVLGRPVNSLNDLLNPAFKHKVGMFGDNQDFPNMGLVAVGVNPEVSTVSDWNRAADWLKKQRDAGLVRQYYEQNYIKPLSSGDIALSMAWSGDIFQANASSNAGLKFVIPQEGGLVWTDNMCIPMHAQHPVDAMIYMDFVYRPDVAAMLADGIDYITPVPGAQAVLQKIDPPIAKDPLVFPPADWYSKVHRYRVLTPSEEQEWNGIFEPIYQS